jgi:hypothetical protein
MFERHKARKAAEAEQKAAQAQQEALTAWETERNVHEKQLEAARTFSGETHSDRMVLKRGEAVFMEVEGSALVEARRGPGEWAGGSHGVSFPIGSIGGRSIRYRVGRTKGHYIQGAEQPTVIDQGTFFITNQRAVFVGTKQTRECLFDKLVGCDYLADAAVLSVSNRQKPTTVLYGRGVAPDAQFRLELALAHWRNDVPSLISQLEEDLAEIDSRKPVPASSGTADDDKTSSEKDDSSEAVPTGTDQNRSEGEEEARSDGGHSEVDDRNGSDEVEGKKPEVEGKKKADWLADPEGRHQYRYFDGVRWTDYVADRGVQSIDPQKSP